jgi:hypothetical protein
VRQARESTAYFIRRVFAGTCLAVASIGFLTGPHEIQAQSAGVPQVDPDLTNQRMLVSPSSTTVWLGKASLTVGPLTYKDGEYTGDYSVTVSPYFFKSQKGPLVLAASDDSVRKLLNGISVEFTGKATNSADGTIKLVKGTATPASGQGGAVTFSISTDNGDMVFNTSYHFVR